MVETQTVQTVLVIVTSYVSTILIFLNFLAILPRIEARYWCFWWLRNKKEFKKLPVKDSLAKNIKSIHLLKGSQLFYVLKVRDISLIQEERKTGNLLVPPLEKIVKDKKNNQNFFFSRTVSHLSTSINFDFGPTIPLVSKDYLYIVVGPSVVKDHDAIYYQGSVRITAYMQAINVQKLMFERSWNNKFAQLEQTLHSAKKK